MNEVTITKCPYCGGHKFAESWLRAGEGVAVHGMHKWFGDQTLYMTVCIDCGSIVRAYVKNPEKLINQKDIQD